MVAKSEDNDVKDVSSMRVFLIFGLYLDELSCHFRGEHIFLGVIEAQPLKIL